MAFVGLVATSSSGAGLALRRSTSQTDWTDQDIGNPAISGNATPTPSGFTIIAGGSDISGRSDQFNFEYQQVNGDVDVRARVDSLAYVSSWSKAGVMIRASLSPNSANAFAWSRLAAAPRSSPARWRVSRPHAPWAQTSPRRYGCGWCVWAAA